MYKLQFSIYLRNLLGRRYSVADEAGSNGTSRLIILRHGADAMLVVEAPISWIIGLQAPPAHLEDRIMLKHLAIYVRRFFAHPEKLPEHSFAWPGTAHSRGLVRQALDPRRGRRAARRSQEQ